MIVKIIAGVIALALIGAYLAAPVFKLREFDLGIAVMAGLAMVLVDLWQSLKSKDD